MGLFVSQLVDVLYYLTSLTVVATQSLVYGDSGEADLQRLTAAISFVNNLVKVCAFVVFWKRSEVVPESE